MEVTIWFLLLSCARLEAPTCEDTDDYACFRGVFRDLLGSPVEGVSVCMPEYEGVDCITSDEDGQWKIPGLPKDENLFVTAEHPDFAPSLFAQTTSMDWYDWYKVMIPLWVMESNANRLELEEDNTKGNILFLIWEGLNLDGIDTNNISGVTAQMEPNSEFLFYTDGLGLASQTADATSGSGSGGVLGLEPGEYALSFQAPAGVCGEQMFHYAYREDGTIPVPVRAGFTTAMDVICPTE
ncbi:MAG: hypothetical protein VX278_23560 [Myxococcota bacterium]|nr:hypothetical protein [Myxococcota bacterium]